MFWSCDHPGIFYMRIQISKRTPASWPFRSRFDLSTSPVHYTNTMNNHLIWFVTLLSLVLLLYYSISAPRGRPDGLWSLTPAGVVVRSQSGALSLRGSYLASLYMIACFRVQYVSCQRGIVGADRSIGYTFRSKLGSEHVGTRPPQSAGRRPSMEDGLSRPSFRP
jgi:hypothetical protein